MTTSRTIHLQAEHDGLTLAGALKRLLADQSWSQVRKLISSRRIQVNGNLTLDEERKVRSGDVLKVLHRALAPPVSADDVRLVYVDQHLLVIQKPAGVTTLRHREEADLPQRRKQLQPTLDELVVQRLAHELGIDLNTSPKRKRGSLNLPIPKRRRGVTPDKRLQIRPVHRLDRDTSGLMLFARTPAAEQKLIRMFARHDVQRAYVAVVHGRVEAQTIDNWLVRDRGDGLRGSTQSGPADTTEHESTSGVVPPQVPSGGRDLPTGGRDLQPQRAITHIRPLEQLKDYTILECRLETGRTHQIRIHLSELGHPLCGERIYTHAVDQSPREDHSGASRQALHAAELAFVHPITNQPLRFRMPLPSDLKHWMVRLRRQNARDELE